MIIKFFLYASSFIVLSYANEVLDIFHLNNHNDHYVILDLESHNKTAYLFDEVNTNICKDINVYGFKINASYKYPLYNAIPKDVYFNIYDTLTVSQISFYQDHSTYFYDTNVAMNSYLRKNINLLTLVESKTLQKKNYTKKVLISLNKIFEKSNLEVGYMYHYESIPTYYSNDSQYNRSIENFSGKFSYNYKNPKIKINNQFNFETSNNQRYNDSEIEFRTQTNWNDLNLTYIFNDNISLGVTSSYKYTASDYDQGNFNKLLLMIEYSLKKHVISFGNIQIKDKNSLYASYLFYNKNYTFFITADKKIFLNIYDNNMNLIYNNEQKVGFTYKNGYINTQAIIGKNSNYINSDYYYYLLSGGIKYKWLGINLNYGNNNSKEMFIKQFTKFDVTFSPVFQNKKYRLYIKANVNRLGINPEFIFNQSNFNLIHELSNNTGISTISILDGEFGIIFKYFKISFIKENMFKDYYQYSTNNFIPNSSNYLVNIIWLFKD